MPQQQQKPRKPGYTFQDMVSLVYDNNWQLYQVFSDALLIAIFWEETMFNNVPQEKGSAVGFGQVEPRELWTLKAYGITTSAKGILADPAHSVEVTATYLRHLYESQTRSSKSRYEALKRYAGYYWDKAAWRLDIIAGWDACCRSLEALPSGAWADHPDAVLNALAQARGFVKSDPTIRGALFP